MREPALISACLVGVHCRYDGRACPHPDLARLTQQYWLIPVCPEQLGGLSTPHPLAEFRGGTGEAVLDGRATVQTQCGQDVTSAFLRGANEALHIATTLGVGVALLKRHSPSCGTTRVTQDGRRVDGQGVAACTLRRAGLRIIALDAPSVE